MQPPKCPDPASPGTLLCLSVKERTWQASPLSYILIPEEFHVASALAGYEIRRGGRMADRAQQGGDLKELPFLTGAQGKGPLLVLLFFVSATVVNVWFTLMPLRVLTTYKPEASIMTT